MRHTGRHDHRRPGLDETSSAFEIELEHAFQHVEAIRMPEVHVQLWPLELAVRRVLDERELGEIDADEREAMRLREPVAIAGCDDDRANVGTALLDASEQMARASGARSLWLTTYRHLPWNRPFYERAGFEYVRAKGQRNCVMRVIVACG